MYVLLMSYMYMYILLQQQQRLPLFILYNSYINGLGGRTQESPLLVVVVTAFHSAIWRLGSPLINKQCILLCRRSQP